MKKIQVEGTPKPVGHYSQAISSQGFLFTSGILPIKIKTSEKLSAETSIDQQLEVIFQNLEAILEQAGLNSNNVVKTTLYITDAEYWEVVNEKYISFFQTHRPARSIIPVKELHFGYKVELEAIAEINE